MATIKTIIGTIEVKETTQEIIDRIYGIKPSIPSWIELTEITKAEKMNGDTVRYEKKININRDFIIIIE